MSKYCLRIFREYKRLSFPGFGFHSYSRFTSFLTQNVFVPLFSSTVAVIHYEKQYFINEYCGISHKVEKNEKLNWFLT